MTSRWTKVKEATSQLIAVCLYEDANPNEMLSSYAWRTGNTKLIKWLDWLMGANHCRESYEWETSRTDTKGQLYASQRR